MTRVLGEQVSRPIAASELDVIEGIDSLVTGVTYTTKELSALCPVTGQPDQYELRLHYSATGRTIESKSLKLYLWSFRDRGIYAENLAGQIARDVCRALRTVVSVTLVQQVRGGLVLDVHAEAEPVLDGGRV